MKSALELTLGISANRRNPTIRAPKTFLYTFNGISAVCQESSRLTEVAFQKQYSIVQSFVKNNPQNLIPCHSEQLSCLKTLSCKWRLNCAVEPNSLQTDARHHGTFKGQGKKTRNSKKGTKPTPPHSQQPTFIQQKRSDKKY